MRRWATWLLVGALVALAAVAVADALRGGTEEQNMRPPSFTVPLISRNEPASSAMGGVLYYSNGAHDCRLDGIIMPTLEAARRPELRSCRFSISPSGSHAVAGAAVWSPHGGLYAREVGDMIALGSPFGREMLRFPGHAPAFRPDGTFTYVRDNRVIAWTTDCPRGSARFTLVGDNATARCRLVVLSNDRLRRILQPGEVGGRLFLRDVAWLGNRRLVAVVGLEAGTAGYRELVPVIENERLIGATMRAFADGLRVEASPRGDFFSAWYGDGLVTVRDRQGREIVFPPLPSVRALTWSADERWTAVATNHSVYVFRTNEGEARVRRLPIEARDLAWR